MFGNADIIDLTAAGALLKGEKPAEVDGEQLLDSIEAALRDISMATHARRACALWALLTHVFDEFEFSPRLIVHAPAPQSGKSTLLERLATVVARPDLCHDLTPAVFFREVNEFRPTIILDDFDSLTRAKQRDLLNVINQGFGRTGCSKRVEQGISCRYSTFAPFAIGTNERLPFAQSSRAIYVFMLRPNAGERVAITRFNGEEIRGRCVRWAESNRAVTAASADLTLPDDLQLDLRQANVWYPLLAVARLCGRKWLDYAFDAARRICAEARQETPLTRGICLLRDIKAVFKVERIFARQLVQKLRRIDDAEWCEIGLTPNKLAIELKKFRIHSKQIRIGSRTGKGYLRADFEDIWDRYIC